jgi:hypothetical protein
MSTTVDQPTDSFEDAPERATLGSAARDYFTRVRGGDVGALPAVAAAYEARAARHARARLVLVAHRIGLLAPDPGGIALWTLPDLASLADVAGEPAGEQEAVELVAAGVYTDVGREIL